MNFLFYFITIFYNLGLISILILICNHVSLFLLFFFFLHRFSMIYLIWLGSFDSSMLWMRK